MHLSRDISIIYKDLVPTSQETLCLHDKDRAFNAVWVNSRYLLLESHETHKQSLWAELSVSEW
jgi:hypothetical protein